MNARVRYDELRPAALADRLRDRPLAWLPLGTLEWHGEHLPFGVDALISEGLLLRCAQKYGGVLLPPLHVGPDRARRQPDGTLLKGMDYDETTDPPRRLPGSAYWVPESLFMLQVEHLLAELREVGFRAVIADGHGPSRWCWAHHASSWSERFGLTLLGVGPEQKPRWTSQTDHAARNETALMLALRPDLVDLSLAEGELVGVAGEDPRLATAEEGEGLLARAVAEVGEWLRAAGL